jgi:hypothetical protein
MNLISFDLLRALLIYQLRNSPNTYGKLLSLGAAAIVFSISPVISLPFNSFYWSTLYGFGIQIISGLQKYIYKLVLRNSVSAFLHYHMIWAYLFALVYVTVLLKFYNTLV